MSAPDREKVLKGLENCSQKQMPCWQCPYSLDPDDPRDCIKELMEDALALLKEQEPVMPVDEQGSTVCGVCGHDVILPTKIEGSITIDYYLNFCPYCGRAVKWE